MPALRDVQTAFAAAILNGAIGRLPLSVAPMALGAERRVQVYRNHFTISLTECLAATFPVLKALVGENYFNQSARRFAAEFPPVSPVLFEYGEAFPGYLAQAAGSNDFAYLADVGAFEWAINCAYHADDAAPIQPHDLLSVAEERWDDVVLRLHPSARLVASEYPVLAIWRAHQPDGTDNEAIDLGRGGVHLLVWRRNLDVGWRVLSAAEAAFVSRLLARSSLGDACAAAVAEDSRFQPGPWLAELFAGALPTGFSLPTSSSER